MARQTEATNQRSRRNTAIRRVSSYMMVFMRDAAGDAVQSYRLVPGSVDDIVGYPYPGYRPDEVKVTTLIILKRDRVRETKVAFGPKDKFVSVEVNDGYEILPNGQYRRIEFRNSSVLTSPIPPRGEFDLEAALETDGNPLYRLNPRNLFQEPV